jgi:hypothetical protein
MLDEIEWAEIGPFLGGRIKALKSYREQHDVGLAEALANVPDTACAAYERMTGYRETNPNAIYHHRLSIYGPPCGRCGRLLRTPAASFCASCGWRRESSTVA